MVLRTPVSIAAFFAAFVVTASTPPASDAIDAVEVTGWLHVQDYTMQDVVVEIDNGAGTMLAHVPENGRFELMLPANTEVTLRFTKPGHLAKEVVVDTRNCTTGAPGKHKRKVEFAVILELERRMGGWVYPGPVGNIGFDEGGGCLAVAHDKRLIGKKQRNAAMEF